MFKLSRLFVALILLFGITSLVLANETGITPEAETVFSFDIQAVSGADEAEVMAGSLLKLIYNAVYLPFAVPLVMLLVSITKRFTTINANILSLLYSVVIWAVWIGANQVGLGGQFESIVSGLTTIAIAILGITITPAGAGALYRFASKHDVAVLGYERTPQRA